MRGQVALIILLAGQPLAERGIRWGGKADLCLVLYLPPAQWTSRLPGQAHFSLDVSLEVTLGD